MNGGLEWIRSWKMRAIVPIAFFAGAAFSTGCGSNGATTRASTSADETSGETPGNPYVDWNDCWYSEYNQHLIDGDFIWPMSNSPNGDSCSNTAAVITCNSYFPGPGDPASQHSDCVLGCSNILCNLVAYGAGPAMDATGAAAFQAATDAWHKCLVNQCGDPGAPASDPETM
jgi:hypothetical protein